MSKEVAIITEKFPVPRILNREDVAEEMDGLNFSFTFVKVPSGGGLAFELPGEDDDDPELTKEIEGVIVYHHPVNVYWAERYDGQNDPPDCAALDGKFGLGDPGGECETCHLGGKDAWGTGKGGVGKACQNRRRVYMLRKGEVFPLLLSLPPSSLTNFGNFISRKVLQRGFRSTDIVAKAKLKKAKNAEGIEYSQATFSVVGALDETTAADMKRYANEIKRLAAGLGPEHVEADSDE